MIKLTIPRKKRKVRGGDTPPFTIEQQEKIDEITKDIYQSLKNGNDPLRDTIKLLKQKIEFYNSNISKEKSLLLLSENDYDKASSLQYNINEIENSIKIYRKLLKEEQGKLEQDEEPPEEQGKLEQDEEPPDERGELEKNDESQKEQDKLEIIDPIIYVKCTENFQDEYNKLVQKYNIINFVLPSDDQFIKFFINNDLSLLKKTIDFDLIKESNKISNHITNSKNKMSELLIDFSDFKKLDTGKNEDNHSIINNHINNIEYEININKLYDTTIYNIVVNSLNLINIYNMLKLVSENIIIDNNHIKLLQTQFKYYYTSCIVARIILIKHINNGVSKYVYIKFYETLISKSKWIIDIHATQSLFKSLKQTQSGGGKKSLSVNKIKEIADKLKVSHSKCKSKESIMTKIKSIDLQKLTIEQLKIYCKLFNIRGCSKCKSKNSLLLHTKSNMKVR